ncbi:MAG: hypothetical protein HY754_04645 [Nitrospirae bacterium]|nr:hypothetical protein [Nitrospirota bacterium]
MHKNKRYLGEFELGAYIEGRLSAKEKESIEKRLSENRRFMDEFIAINRIINHETNIPHKCTKDNKNVIPAKAGIQMQKETGCPIKDFGHDKIEAENNKLLEDAPEYLIKKAINFYHEKRNLFDIIVNLVTDAINVVHVAHDINVFMPLPAYDLRNTRVSAPIMVVLNKNFENINVELDIEKVADDFCNIKAVVSDIETKALLESLRVELISEGRELVSAPLENGVVILEDVRPGRYIIKINKKGKIMGELSVKIE